MGSDPFEDAGATTTEADPFADDTENSELQSEVEAPAEAQAAAPPAEAPAPASAIDPPDEEPPLVDREGEPVAPAPEAAAVEAPPEPQTDPAGPPEQPPADPPAPPAQEDPEAAQATAPPAEAAQTANGTTEAAQEASGDDEKLRLYHAMYQTAADQWTDLPLKPDSANVTTVDGKLWLQARSSDHARRLAWGIANRPAEGVTLVVVAKGGWSPKRVRPKPPEPDRERLEIS